MFFLCADCVSKYVLCRFRPAKGDAFKRLINVTNVRNSHELKFVMKSLTFPWLICSLNLYFAQKFLRKLLLVTNIKVD